MKFFLSFFLTTLFCASIANYVGRLDSYGVVGFVSPKNVFQIGEYVYLQTYFDIFNETVTSINANTFKVQLWNGQLNVFYQNNEFKESAELVELVIGQNENNYGVNFILKLNPSVFPITDGTEKYVNFILVVDIIFVNKPTETYWLSSQIKIQNNFHPVTTHKITSGIYSTTKSVQTTSSKSLTTFDSTSGLQVIGSESSTTRFQESSTTGLESLTTGSESLTTGFEITGSESSTTEFQSSGSKNLTSFELTSGFEATGSESSTTSDPTVSSSSQIKICLFIIQILIFFY